ncbi:PRKCA-binding protein isoform X1 [Chrysoperla carnea]|uniref:PRKCA-binding protein isoform X1 n=1 Tax=Chrysoperla carnea TaxID=189513 RepID=UPI001D0704A4|nr:PRKCA-binding protein isoform X1 [Chrysoperla carnea]
MYLPGQPYNDAFLHEGFPFTPYWPVGGYSEDKMGMTVTSGSVVIKKDGTNLIGISIGGGAPLCPCLYIVQVFDNTPAAKDGTLQAGDELIGINGQSVKGKTKVEVAKMIQAAKDEVHINYNKLHADPKQGKSLDIVLKKVKHRLVENMSTATADALGLSRAILCNDTLVKKLEELQNTEIMYKGLVEQVKRMLQAYADTLQCYKNFGDVFASIGVKEPQPRASEAFRKFGEQHRQMDKDGQKMLQAVKPVLSDMGTYLNKAIPDTRLTIKKYADAKFEYLSYCLKVKEMDDEEHNYAALQEPLYRVDTGNYEYRLILRCRQEARLKFAQLRSDVLVKMELLDNKHAEVVSQHLRRLLTGLQQLHSDMLETVNGPKLFPVEVDLNPNAFQYKSTTPFVPETTDDDELIEAEEAKEENSNLLDNAKDLKSMGNIKKSDDNPNSLLLDMEPSTSNNSILNSPTSSTHLIPDLFDFDMDKKSNNKSQNVQTTSTPTSSNGSVPTQKTKSTKNGTIESSNKIANDNSQSLLIPDLETLSISQVEPDYDSMDNATLLAGLSLNPSTNSSHNLISTLDN